MTRMMAMSFLRGTGSAYNQPSVSRGMRRRPPGPPWLGPAPMSETSIPTSARDQFAGEPLDFVDDVLG